MNVIADPTNPRPQRAYSTDNEVYLHSRLRRAVQCRNDVLIEKRIHFRNDASRVPQPRVIALAGDQIKAVLRNVYRRNHQRCVAGVLRIGGEKAEHVVNRFGDGLICGHKTQIGIKLCRGRVVVAGSKVGIAPRNSIRIFPHQK